MAILCRDLNLLFIMVPGTGCSVVGSTLRKEFGGEWFPPENVFEGSRLLVAHKHCSLPQLLEHGLLSPEERRAVTVFATVRNPFDRLATEYQRLVGEWTSQQLRHQEHWRSGDAAQKANQAIRERRTGQRVRYARMLGFDGWITARLAKWRYDTRWMSHEKRHARYHQLVYPSTEGVDRYLRYEHLETDLNSVLAQSGVQGTVQLPRANQTPGKAPYQSYYSAFSRSLVERMLREELARFDYHFEEAQVSSIEVAAA